MKLVYFLALSLASYGIARALNQTYLYLESESDSRFWKNIFFLLQWPFWILGIFGIFCIGWADELMSMRLEKIHHAELLRARDLGKAEASAYARDKLRIASELGSKECAEAYQWYLREESQIRKEFKEVLSRFPNKRQAYQYASIYDSNPQHPFPEGYCANDLRALSALIQYEKELDRVCRSATDFESRFPSLYSNFDFDYNDWLKSEYKKLGLR